jgi:hypothetical protein
MWYNCTLAVDLQQPAKANKGLPAYKYLTRPKFSIQSMYVFFSNIFAESSLDSSEYTVLCDSTFTSPHFEVFCVLVRPKLLMFCIHRSSKMHYKLMARVLPILFTVAHWTDIVL